jgi:hypothetical protein
VADLGTARFGHLAAPLRGGGALIVQGTLSYDQVPNVKYRDVQEALTYSETDFNWVDIGVPPVETAATSVTRMGDGTLLFVGAATRGAVPLLKDESDGAVDQRRLHEARRLRIGDCARRVVSGSRYLHLW